MLQAYNCDLHAADAISKRVMPAEKQFYKPEYVKLHFNHYTPVTTLSEMSRSEYEAAGYDWSKARIDPNY